MSLQRVEEFFAPGGLVSKVLAPTYEHRAEQAEMARETYRTLRDGGILLLEAPTGIGKSLAYLVPGILWALEMKRPFVVATYTKTLQDQILANDLPRIRRMINRQIRVAVLKGRANYLCRARWNHYLDEVRGTPEGEDLERALGYWVQVTETGDLSEAPVPPGRRGARVVAALPRIAGESRFCSASRCTPESGCYFRVSRARARDAHLIVINHSLLMIDLFAEAAGLPEWSAVVVDEGHHLPRVAAEPLSRAVSEGGLDSAMKGLGGRGEPGLTEQLRKVLRGHPDREERARVLDAIRELESETGSLAVMARAFWSELKSAPGFPRGDHRLRYSATTGTLFGATALDFCRRFDRHLGRLGEEIDEVGRLRRSATESELLPLREAERLLDEGRSTLDTLGELITPDRAGYIYWIEPETSVGVSLRCAPLEVGRQLRDALFLAKSSVIVTSATLALQGSFDHIARKLGLPPDHYQGVALATPFRLEEQVKALVAGGMPEPNDPAFAEALARGIGELAVRLRRKMLVLFTSHEMLRRVEAAVRPTLVDRGIRLLAQGLDGGARRVRDDFQDGGAAVLLGAAGFWEGVDFPGEDLEILVMARLPFLVPTDPLVEAMGERLEAEGQEPFKDYYLPEAIVRFRQGFGRLIRRRGDRGVFVVVDPRLSSRGYGRLFQRAVGVPFHTAGSWNEVLELSAAWFDAQP